ncbi:MAG: hypothetical protein IPM16_05105 [Chloroflexi bacterium]|nr:hypothetical protein [Chloroflexota bacterium]
MPSGIKLGWERFKLISKIIGEVQGRVIITAFYYTILIPFGLISRFLTDPLQRKGEVGWVERHPVGRDIKSARNQW